MTRSPNRRHSRESFYKYMSAETAKIVMASRSLRWSSPILFNDPFDVPREIAFGISAEDVKRAMGEHLGRLIEAPPDSLDDLGPKIRLLIETAKNRLTSEARCQMAARIRQSSNDNNPSSDSMELFRHQWRSWIPDFRILCLCESHEHVAMWYHYADKYRGVALELRCDDQLDSAWLSALPVTYPEDKPNIFFAEGWAKLLTKPIESAIKELLQVCTYTKSPDWEYEHEWRVATFKRPSDAGNYTDYKFNERELAGVYLGPAISDAARKYFVTIKAQMPHLKIFETQFWYG
jgi:hypothetical protein